MFIRSYVLYCANLYWGSVLSTCYILSEENHGREAVLFYHSRSVTNNYIYYQKVIIIIFLKNKWIFQFKKCQIAHYGIMSKKLANIHKDVEFPK